MMPEHALSQINALHGKQNEGIEGQVVQFKHALQKILSDNTLSPETQVKLYNQLFTRYLKLDTDAKAPATFFMYSDTFDDDSKYENKESNDPVKKETQEAIQDQWKSAVFEKIPKMHKEKQ